MLRVLMSLTLAGAALGAPLAQATSYDLLVGTYTQGTSQGIYRLTFDSDTGQIARTPAQVVKTDNPSWLTLNQDQDRLFVVNDNNFPDSNGRVPGKPDDVEAIIVRLD